MKNKQKVMSHNITITYDGFFFLNTMKDVPHTFDNISKKFLQILLVNRATTVIIIFNTYTSRSIKDLEHEFQRTNRHQHFQSNCVCPNLAELKT